MEFFNQYNSNKVSNFCLISVSGMNQDPSEYVTATQYRSIFASDVFKNTPSFYYNKGINPFNIPLDPSFYNYGDPSKSNQFNIEMITSDKPIMTFVTGNIGSGRDQTIFTIANNSNDIFGQGPGFNFTTEQATKLGLTSGSMSNDTQCVLIPMNIWQEIFSKYGDANKILQTGLGSMLTSLFGDHFFNGHKKIDSNGNIAVIDSTIQYGRTNWTFEEATNFMIELGRIIIINDVDRNNIIQLVINRYDENNHFSKESVEMMYKPLAFLRSKHKDENNEIEFLTFIRNKAIELLISKNCGALEYDGVVSHTALVVTYYKILGFEVNFDSNVPDMQNITIRQLCRNNHINVIRWSLGIVTKDIHIDKLITAGSYIKSNYHVNFIHDMGLDPNCDDFIAINIFIKAMEYNN